MEWLENIKRIKSARKMTNEELSKASGIPTGTLNKMLAGQNASIKLEKIFDLARALQVSPAELIGGQMDFSEDEKEIIAMLRELDESKKTAVISDIRREYNITIAKRRSNDTLFTVAPENTRTIPFYDAPVSAGRGNYLDSDYSRTITLNLNATTERADFAVRVRGDSMLPKYNDGDIVIVEAASAVDEGNIGIFVLNGESYIKKMGRNTLISLNQKYSAISLSSDDEFECKGLVIGRLKAV